MKKKIVVLPLVALISLSGLTACGAAQDAVEQKANDEIQNGKTQVEQRVQQEKTNAVEKVKEGVENQGGG